MFDPDEFQQTTVLVQKVYELLQSGKLSGWWKAPNGGPYLQEFERKFAAYVGTNHAIAVSSGSAAIYVALRAACRDLENTYVAVSPYTHIGSVAPIVMAGGVPKFIDVDDYGNMSPPDLDSEGFGAVIVPHQLGQPSCMDEIIEISHSFQHAGSPVIEDCSQALGAKYNGKMAGSIGDVGCFSIGGDMTKTISTGEGGMITTNDYHIADKCRKIRNHGEREGAVFLCFNFRMSELQALVGLLQMDGIQTQVDWQVKNADYLIRNLPSCLQVPEPPAITDPCRYIIGCRYVGQLTRDRYLEGVYNRGYRGGEPRRNVGPGYQKLVYEIPFYGQWARRCPNAEALRDRAVWIDWHRYPCTREEIDKLLMSLPFM